MYLLVCDVGSDIDRLGQAIADACDGKFSLHVPKGLMYVDATGIPLVLKSSNAAKADALLRRADILKMAVKGSLPSGAGWAGVRVADGTVTAIAEAEVVSAVSAHFGG